MPSFKSDIPSEPALSELRFVDGFTTKGLRHRRRTNGGNEERQRNGIVTRQPRPFFRSRPGRLLLWSTVALVALTVAIPYLPFIGVFGFVPLPGMLLITVAAITALYVVATELTKRRFYRGVL